MKRLPRRGFLKTACSCAAVLAMAPVTRAAAGSGRRPINDDEVGMLYDATRCVGCKACMAACKRHNSASGNLQCEKARFDKDGIWDAPADLSGNNRTVIELCKESSTSWSYVKRSCMHCQKPSCVSACPVAALTKDPATGIVSYNSSACIGCRYCQIACPFNIPKFQWDRPAPQIVKCNFCKDTYFKEKGITACADVCPAKAIVCGKRGALLADARTRIRENPRRYIDRIYGEHEVGGTNHLYLAGLPFSKLGLPSLPDDPPSVFSETIHHTVYKGFIAPIALYSALYLVARRNMNREKGHRTANAGDASGGRD